MCIHVCLYDIYGNTHDLGWGYWLATLDYQDIKCLDIERSRPNTMH